MKNLLDPQLFATQPLTYQHQYLSHILSLLARKYASLSSPYEAFLHIEPDTVYCLSVYKRLYRIWTQARHRTLDHKHAKQVHRLSAMHKELHAMDMQEQQDADAFLHNTLKNF